jgi:hypothetical protein
MSGWDDPTGRPYYAVGICDRCNFRFFLDELIPDGNLPGLRVCRECWDELDPYRLPARQPDNIILPFVRPDVPIALAVAASESALFALTTEDDIPLITQDDELLVVEAAP